MQEGHPTCVNLTPIPHTDGHLWRKYGEKKIKNSSFPRYVLEIFNIPYIAILTHV
jgi:hypothetical protein